MQLNFKTKLCFYQKVWIFVKGKKVLTFFSQQWSSRTAFYNRIFVSEREKPFCRSCPTSAGWTRIRWIWWRSQNCCRIHNCNHCFTGIGQKRSVWKLPLPCSSTEPAICLHWQPIGNSFVGCSLVLCLLNVNLVEQKKTTKSRIIGRRISKYKKSFELALKDLVVRCIQNLTEGAE